jgi:hypothetical protein
MLRPSPVLAPFLDERFGLDHRLRDAIYPLHIDLVQLLHVGLTIDPIVPHIDTGFLPSFLQLGLGGDDRRQQAELIIAVAIQGCMSGRTSPACVFASTAPIVRWERFCGKPSTGSIIMTNTGHMRACSSSHPINLPEIMICQWSLICPYLDT